MTRAPVTANRLQEGIFHLEAAIKEARDDFNWDRVDCLGEQHAAWLDQLEALTKTTTN
jgi:hypothetical protein